jgi:membrane associated rhomboid family serine protease
MLGGSLTRSVKWLIVVTTAIYLAQFAARYGGLEKELLARLALTPGLFVGSLALWQPFTYLFLHATTDPMHLVLNMLGLWMFGGPLEQIWGTRKFLFFYGVCGVAGGLCVVLGGLLVPSWWLVPTIGQSGALYGLIGAFGVIFAEQRIWFYAVIPVKAKVFVWVLVGIAVLYALAGSPHSFPAHMGGLLCGVLLVTGWWNPRLLWLKLQYWRLTRRRGRLRAIDGGGGYVH